MKTFQNPPPGLRSRLLNLSNAKSFDLAFREQMSLLKNQINGKSWSYGGNALQRLWCFLKT
jgi:hypothetical protein